jgi:hypothetical protein
MNNGGNSVTKEFQVLIPPEEIFSLAFGPQEKPSASL